MGANANQNDVRATGSTGSAAQAAQEPRRRSGIRIMGRLIGLVKPLAGRMALAIGFGVIGHLCAIAVPVLGTFALLAALGTYQASLVALAVALIACALGRGVFHYAEQYNNHLIAFKILALVRDRVFTALRRLCPAKLEGRRRGDLIALITTDIELLEVFYAHTISPIAIAVTVSLVMTVAIGLFNPLLGLLALAAYVIVGAVTPLLTSRLGRRVGMRYRVKFAGLSSFYLDSLRGLHEILQYGQGEARMGQMGRLTDEMEVDQKRLKAAEGLVAGIANVEVLVLDFAMLAASLALPTSAPTALAGAALPTVMMMSSFGPVLALSALASTLSSTLAAGERVLSLLEEEPVVTDVADGVRPEAFTGLEARDLDFSYGPNEESVLSGVNAKFPAGRIVGVQGRSGSGKSTLLKLLMRFWNAPEGSVRVCGEPIGRVDTSWLRGEESYMTQETDLFHDTIANNIRVGKLDATDEEVVAAAKKAALHDFVMTLPKGYETEVGELGGTLSAGERQRLGLARAFVHGGDVLLLDEPTSNLDSLNEGTILKALKEERGSRAVVLVSHRSSTMGIADEVYSVEDGRVS